MDKLLDRKFTDAERALEQVKERKFGEDEYREGYIIALEGILISSRSGDERDFLNKATNTTEELKKYKAEFKAFTTKPIKSQFDDGYFTAWKDFMTYRMNQEKT
jgi:hypothetical protein